MLNDAGRSYAFDSRGSGYGRGEGVVTVLLKRLDEALRAADSVRAIIRSTAVNQDGKTDGITLPSQEAQENLARLVYNRAGLNPLNTNYVEAHGTGTVSGDLLEMQGIATVFCENGDRQGTLYVGSIKSNIGHLESSSGLAGLIKTVLVLEKGVIPPNADFQAKKKDLKLEDWNIKVIIKFLRSAAGYPLTRARYHQDLSCGQIVGLAKPQLTALVMAAQMRMPFWSQLLRVLNWFQEIKGTQPIKRTIASTPCIGSTSAMLRVRSQLSLIF